MMKKRLRILLVGLALSTFIMGCTNQVFKQEESHLASGSQVVTECVYNTAFEKYAEDEELGLIINEPTKEELESFTHLETYKYIEESEKLLIVPKYNGSKVTIQQVEFKDDYFIAKETLYSKEQTENNYGLLLETVRPEGIPELMITITAREKRIDYLVAYNGKDGTPHVEYLTLEETKEPEENEEVQNEEVQVIRPMLEGDYLQGYNLLDQREVDIDSDQIMEYLEVYSTAGYDEKGNLLIDDGQNWALIVRKGDQIYPVFERSFIQLGQLEYKVYTEYAKENIFHILVSKVQGAGITLYDCYYDRESDAFICKIVYETTGNIGVGTQYN